MDKKVSVIIPAYNVQDYLKRCIESVINQTYSNLEIIIVNDGSTDNTKDIIDEYAETDNRIVNISQKNMGLSGARNSGIEVSTGDYLYLLDSDDYINEKTIEILIKGIKDDQKYIVSGERLLVYDDYKIQNFNNEIIYKEIENDKAQINICNGKPPYGVVWNKLFSKEIFKTIKFPVGKIHEDEYVIYKLLDKSDVIIHCNYPTYYYYQRIGSIMRSKFSKHEINAYCAYKERTEYFYKNSRKKVALVNQKKQYYALLKYISRQYNELGKLDSFIKDELNNNIMKYIKNIYIPLYQKVFIILIRINNKFLKVYNKRIENVDNK